MQIIKFIIFGLLSISIISCKSVLQVNNIGLYATDSTMFFCQDSTIIINIGDKIDPTPIVSQIYRDSLYIILDQNELHCFDLNTGDFTDRIKLRNCGKLNNYSGFNFANDSVIVYNYKEKRVYILDSASNILSKYNVKDKSLAKYTVDPEALTSSPVLYANSTILLSGTGFGQPNDATFENKPVSCLIDLKTKKLKYGVGYPQQYRDGNFGGIYFNTIYHTLNNNGEFIYSFPADHNIYIYDPKINEYKSIYMGSRYFNFIESSKYNELEIAVNKDLRIEYYLSQPSYGEIKYDKYKDVYYRFVYHPQNKWDGTGRFFKPFSIIVMNSIGDILSETPIIDNSSVLASNAHVTKQGLLIQRKSLNENIIEFLIYK